MKKRMQMFLILLFVFVVVVCGISQANDGVDTRTERIEALIPIGQSVCALIYIMPTQGDSLYSTVVRRSGSEESELVSNHHFESSEAVEGESFFVVTDRCAPSGDLRYDLLVRSESETDWFSTGWENIEMPETSTPCTDTDDVCAEAFTIWKTQSEADDDDDDESGCGCSASGSHDKSVAVFVTNLLLLLGLVAFVLGIKRSTGK